MKHFGAVSRAIALAAVLGGVAVQAQGTSPMVKDDLFNGTEKFAKGASDVTEVTMDPDTLNMVNGDNARRAHGMVLNVVRTYEYDKPGMYNISDVEAIRQRLNTGDWHCSVHTQDVKHGESTDICNKHRTDGLVEQAIITVEPKELTFVHTIKHGENRIDSHRDGGAGESMLMMEPGMDVEMAVAEARMAAMSPAMEARMAAMGPEMEAHMAGVQARLSALRSGAASSLSGAETEKLQEQMGALGESAERGEHGSGSSRRHAPVAPVPPAPPVMSPAAPAPPAAPMPPAPGI